MQQTSNEQARALKKLFKEKKLEQQSVLKMSISKLQNILNKEKPRVSLKNQDKRDSFKKKSVTQIPMDFQAFGQNNLLSVLETESERTSSSESSSPDLEKRKKPKNSRANNIRISTHLKMSINAKFYIHRASPTTSRHGDRNKGSKRSNRQSRRSVFLTHNSTFRMSINKLQAIRQSFMKFSRLSQQRSSAARTSRQSVNKVQIKRSSTVLPPMVRVECLESRDKVIRKKSEES